MGLIMRIAVYAITKNESQFVKRFLDSITDADHIVICDTGSTDTTWSDIDSWQIGNPHGIKVSKHKIHVSPWRFDVARNASLALVPADVDVCICMDLDEVMTPGWRKVIEETWVLGTTTRLWYLFDWSNGLIFQQEKIHARHGYHWRYPVHEYAMPYGIEQVYASTDKLLFHHMPDDTKSRKSYLPLLKMAVEEEPNSPKNALYYGRELSFDGRWVDAIRQCHKYLAMPEAKWNHERQLAWRVIGQCYAELDLFEPAVAAFESAGRELPTGREHNFELAKLYEKRQNWVKAFEHATACTVTKDRAAAYTVDPKAWGNRPHDIAAISAYNLGLYDVAASHGLLALSLDPADERLLKNVKFYEEKARAGK
jgi:glycosyltransferase involved in cell wall biosynthesis